MQILVLYSTVEGHTAKIARRIANKIEALGNEVFLTETSDPGYCDPGVFDAAILCAPIHMGMYPDEFVQYVKDWQPVLSRVPSALITSSLLIACKDDDAQKEAKAYPAKLIFETDWEPDKTYNIAGSLNYPEYDFFKRWIMKRAARSENWSDDTREEHDFTQWDDLETFTDDFLTFIRKEAA